MNFAKPSVLNASLTTALASAPGLTPAIGTAATHPLLQSSWQGASAIAFIDASVSDYQTLVAGIAPGTEVHILNSSQDAVTQITNTLLGRHNISSLHIVSHGEAGGLDFGTGKLNLSDLPEYAAQLQSWSKALTDDADILLYGCDVAQGELGQAFTSILSQLTGADVAASADLTGSAALGGNWTLEYQTGSIEAGLAFSPSVRESYTYILPSFTAATPVAVGSSPRSVAIGDFNGDGKADFATANYNDNTVSVRLGNGLGGFSGSTTVAVGANPASVAIGDFNGDGKADFATANVNSNTVSVRLGDGLGGFSGTTTVNVGTVPYSVAIGDFNGDGKADFATANLFSGTVSVRLGDGLGGFSGSTDVAVGSSPQSVAIGDFNGDGKADFAAANVNSNTVSVRLGDGLGGFSGTTTVNVGTSPYSVVIGDFNGDGKADFAAANQNSNNVSIRLGDGLGGFSGTTTVAVGTNPYSVAIGDFNGDGKADFATANLGSNNVSIRLGDGLGGFSGTTNVAVGSGPISVAIGDLNGDGKADIVAANNGSDTVSVLLNTSPKITVAAGTAPAEIGTTGTFTLTLDQPAPAGGLTVNFTPSGTATNPADYSFSTGSNITSVSANSFVVAAGATTATLNVVPVNDGIVDPNETVILTLAAGNDYFLGSNATAQFAATSPVAVGTQPLSVAIGDLNGDGKADFVAANYGSNTVSVRLGDGLGGFSGTTNVAVGGNPNSVAIGDFNGDGKADLAVANESTNNVSVLLGTGSGSFGAATNFTVGANPAFVAIGDFNGDGKADLAVANESTNNVSVLLGTGSGSFGAATNFTVGTNPRSVAIGDFNGDGKADLATANRGSNNVSVLLGIGNGSFGAATNFTVGANPRSVAIGDFNGDGKADLATPNFDSNNVSVLLGTGSGSFGAATNFTVGTGPYSVAIGDFNGDGKADLAAANIVSNNVSVLLGTGSGSFGAATNFTVGAAPFSVAIRDFNGDGKADIAAANRDTNNVSVLLNTAPSATLVIAENTAPVLNAAPNPALTAINEDAGAPTGAVGTLVSTLVDLPGGGGLDNVTDPDSGAVTGIAITAADTTNGTWFYSTNNGTNWTALGTVSNTTARLLAADANTRVYFQPNANYNGTVTNGITFRAWDTTSGTNGALANTSTNGGTTAFSTVTDTASLTVNAVNDAPILSVLSNSLNLDGINDYVSTTAPITHNQNFTYEAWVKFPTNNPAWSGIITTSTLAGSGGFVQFSNNGSGRLRAEISGSSTFNVDGTISMSDGNWHHVALTYDGASLKTYVDGALDINSSVNQTFTVNRQVFIGAERQLSAGWTPAGQITEVRIWNATRTQAEIQANRNQAIAPNSTGLIGYWQLNQNSGTTANDLSSSGLNATLFNGATWVTNSPFPGSISLAAINEDAGAPTGTVGTLVSALVDLNPPIGGLDNITDADTGALTGIAITAADTTNGIWFYSTNNGTNWIALGAVANTTARLLAADANTRVYFQPNANYNGTVTNGITFRAWDTTSGTNGALANTSTNGGTTAFSIVTNTAAITVNAVNDAPTLSLPTAGSVTYTENGIAVVLDASATISDIDSTSFNTGNLTVSYTAGGTADDRLTILNQGTGAGLISLDGRIVNFGGTTIGTYTGGIGTTPLVITFNSAATPAAAQALVRTIAFANVSQAPSTTARSLQVTVSDGISTSTPATRTINVTAVNDAPIVGTTTVLYDGATGTLPSSAQGWLYGGPGVTPTVSSGTTNLNTTANASFAAGFSNSSVVLDRTAGYVVSFNAQVVSESRTATADKDLDGKDDRAGFSIIVVSSDTTKAIELGFLSNQIFAQEDGTNQVDPSLQPDTTAPNATRTLFTQAEAATFTTTAATNYDLAVKDDTYTLFANGTVILSGRLRDYTGFSGTPDPYQVPNQIFFGDDTTSAVANLNLSRVAVTTNPATLPSQTVNEDTAIVLPNLFMTDLDAGSSPVTLTLAVANGTVTVNNVSGSTLSNNGTATVTVTGTLSQINAILTNATGITYQGNANVNGTDTLTLSLNDNGASGGSAITTTKTLPIVINAVNDLPTGAVTITGTPTQNQTLTAANTLADVDGLGTITYQWQANGTDIAGATGNTLVLGQAQVGKTITVKASYTDLQSTAEVVTSTATAAVANVNDLPTGAVTITGTPTQNQTLTAANTLADVDGLGTITYQWQANGTDIAGATGNTLVLGQAQVGKTITVKASYTDLQSTAEVVTSTATTAVANVNDLPTGAVTITGTPTQNQTLTAANTLADVDGLGTITYQWQANGTDIAGATGNTLVLGQAQVGKTITVKASYTDLQSTAEVVTSTATAAVANVNDLPTGAVTITGTPTQNQTLTAANTLADVDGLGTITYQWQANGTDIAGATGNTLVLGQAQVGKTITVKASYTDLQSTAEVVTSTATTAVANVNDAPTLTGDTTLAAVAQNTTNPSGRTLTSLFGSLFSDPDASATLSGLAIRGNTASAGNEGTWQYSIDGTIWSTIGTVADGATALALSASTLVRFVPVSGYNGTPGGLTVRALDNSYSGGFSTNSNRVTIDTTTNGGSSAIAATFSALTTSVTPGAPGLVWRNGVTGENVSWQLSGYSIQTSYFLPTLTDTAWQIVSSTTDFNQDGFADLLWRNTRTGENAIWQMNNTGYQTGYFTTAVTDTNWQIVGTADFTSDTKPDLLWRNSKTGENAIWQMNGFTVQTTALITTVADTNWQIVGIADFTSDTKPDLLWRNSKTGENAIWQMNGLSVQTTAFITPLADANWQIVGTGNFNGDATPDIVWRNNKTGENAIWQMNGTTRQSGYFITSVTDLSWQIVGVANLGGDSTPELLWRSKSTSQSAIWQLNGFSYGQSYQFQKVSSDWSVKPFVV